MATKHRSRAAVDADMVARMMAAQDQEEGETGGGELPVEAPAVASEPAPPVASTPQPPAQPEPPAFDPGKTDGRTLRKTGREPFATRIKPETHEAMRRMAYLQGLTIAEVLEKAVADAAAAFDKR